MTHSGTGVTDADLKVLAPVTNPAFKNLSETKVTDAGLKELSTFNKLDTVHVRDPKVTDLGVAEPKKALPKCKFHHR